MLLAVEPLKPFPIELIKDAPDYESYGSDLSDRFMVFLIYSMSLFAAPGQILLKVGLVVDRDHCCCTLEVLKVTGLEHL